MISEKKITPELVKQHNLTEDEYAKVLEILGRTPTITELGIFSAMWSEHCSYKSTKKWLKTMHTTAPWVICGPGENAGVIDIGDGQAVIFKMESHNHPHLSSHIRAPQLVLAGFCAMCLRWVRVRLPI